jgi:hypothetical protein
MKEALKCRHNSRKRNYEQTAFTELLGGPRMFQNMTFVYFQKVALERVGTTYSFMQRSTMLNPTTLAVRIIIGGSRIGFQ